MRPPRPTLPSWDHRDLARCREVFADDYEYVYPETTARGAGDQLTLRREDELSATLHLFQRGTAIRPPARRVALDFSAPLTVLPDSRPGKEARWHQEISTRFDLAVDTDSTLYRVEGMLRCFVVRGDSAAIPQDLRDQGARPDTSRWYVVRLEESGPTAASVRGAVAGESRYADGSRAMPSRRMSWGLLKVIYLELASSGTRLARPVIEPH